MKYLMVLSLVLITGCAEWQAVKNGVGFYGSQASDEALSTAIWTVCKASPVGAITRRFNTADRRLTWQKLCSEVKEAP